MEDLRRIGGSNNHHNKKHWLDRKYNTKSPFHFQALKDLLQD